MKVEILDVSERKNQVVAGLLSIFMWPLGAHCFYLRQFAGGFLNVFLSCLFTISITHPMPWLTKLWNIETIKTYSTLSLFLLGLISTIYGLCLLSMKVSDFNMMFNVKK